MRNWENQPPHRDQVTSSKKTVEVVRFRARQRIPLRSHYPVDLQASLASARDLDSGPIEGFDQKVLGRSNNMTGHLLCLTRRRRRGFSPNPSHRDRSWVATGFQPVVCDQHILPSHRDRSPRLFKLLDPNPNFRLEKKGKHLHSFTIPLRLEHQK